MTVAYHRLVIKVLVSACLLGAPVRYNGEHKESTHPVLRRWIEEGRIVSVCPEMLGGLGTPRPPAEIVNDGSRRVVTPDGTDVTQAFEAGASLALEQADAHDVRVAVLKSNSPSCGTSFIYDCTFSGTAIHGEGITTSLLRQRGLAVFSEAEFEAADELEISLERQFGATRE
jgi:uncharacterized protein YbbK (DUF523 family)